MEYINNTNMAGIKNINYDEIVNFWNNFYNDQSNIMDKENLMFITSDIHGDLNALLNFLISTNFACFEDQNNLSKNYMISENNMIRIPNLKINKNFNNKLFILGDVIDRGNYNQECFYLIKDILEQIDILSESHINLQDSLQYIVGNHEFERVIFDYYYYRNSTDPQISTYLSDNEDENSFLLMQDNILKLMCNKKIKFCTNIKNAIASHTIFSIDNIKYLNDIFKIHNYKIIDINIKNLFNNLVQLVQTTNTQNYEQHNIELLTTKINFLNELFYNLIEFISKNNPRNYKNNLLNFISKNISENYKNIFINFILKNISENNKNIFINFILKNISENDKNIFINFILEDDKKSKIYSNYSNLLLYLLSQRTNNINISHINSLLKIIGHEPSISHKMISDKQNNILKIDLLQSSGFYKRLGDTTSYPSCIVFDNNSNIFYNLLLYKINNNVYKNVIIKQCDEHLTISDYNGEQNIFTKNQNKYNEINNLQYNNQKYKTTTQLMKDYEIIDNQNVIYQIKPQLIKKDKYHNNNNNNIMLQQLHRQQNKKNIKIPKGLPKSQTRSIKEEKSPIQQNNNVYELASLSNAFIQ